ncbi:hypothetical protein RCG23_22740 [Neobacillus sp. PS3-34]|uniref:hypothetical protein n=1 Tax=Neobacillus sp. PS3-34 TaxID=3070678 RepID=UPI0027E0C669|nr:hypothetical protein [Neobacillus sp. PS3-34]WML48071.1 hypothetical protein RCG23_22740 [Neobacillus sp. PS3-34]
MSKRSTKISIFIAMLLILGFVVALWHNNTALADNKAVNKTATAASIMSKYSVKDNDQTQAPIRKGRLNQINFVTEAAQILNVLPITIMQEMEKEKTVVQIAQEKGYSKAEFLQKLTDLENKTINAAATSGTISQKHANALHQGQADRLKYNLDLKAVNVNDHQAMDMNH